MKVGNVVQAVRGSLAAAIDCDRGATDHFMTHGNEVGVIVEPYMTTLRRGVWAVRFNDRTGVFVMYSEELIVIGSDQDRVVLLDQVAQEIERCLDALR